jgi:hypothetical protein
MSKQTALQWFVEQLGLDATTDYKDEIQQALQMEREQIEDAFKHGQNNGFMYHERGFDTISSNQFYEQTYGGQDE